jgi:hypothetical protein
MPCGEDRPCYGVCGGDPSYRDPKLKTPCSLCQGSGIVKAGLTQAEDYEIISAKFDARAQKRRSFGKRHSRPLNTKPGRRQSRAKVARKLRGMVDARERAAWFADNAYTEEQQKEQAKLLAEFQSQRKRR